MPIKIKIGKGEEKKRTDLPKFDLNIRKTLGGDFVVFDHPDVDVVIMPEKRKILVLTNDSLNSSSKTYDVQNKFFKYMMKKGIIQPESIKVGNVYGSLEAKYPELKDPQEGVSATDMVLLVISKWIKEEKPEWIAEKEIEQREIDRKTDPEPDETTPLGKVGHSEKKGSNYPLATSGARGGF